MAGSHANRPRRDGHVVGLAVTLLALVATARAQGPGLPSTAPPRDLASIVDETEPNTEPLFPQPLSMAPSFGAGGRPVPIAPGIEMGLLDTVTESLFGDVYAEGRWRPLSLSTFFSEGWLEPWASAPAGQDGLTPRHGWRGAFDGVFYRLWLATFGYSNSINAPYGGNRYFGNYTIFLPFSRRFEIVMNVPFVVANGTKDPMRGYTSEFGDLAVAPRFLLSETAATSQVFALGIRTPTGTTATGNGIISLVPAYEFWTNPGGPWVVRGSTGLSVPLNKNQAPAENAFVGGLAAGRYFTPHDALFGDLVFYLDTNFAVPLDGGARRNTLFSLGPGTRFHIADNWFFLYNWEFPITGNRPNTYTMQVALLKEF